MYTKPSKCFWFEEVMDMGSKYLDIGLALFMGYFAYNRYENGQYGFAILFAILALFNLVMAVLKHKNSHNNAS
jgi:hypothetical protein